MKKGFTRTLEAVIAIVLLSGLITWATNTVSAFSRTEPLRFEGEDVLSVLQNTGTLTNVLEQYDFRALDSFIYHALPSSVKHKIQVEKYVSIRLIENMGENITQTIGFTYNFPTGTETDSISLFSEDYSYDHNAIWCWYMVPITIKGSSQDMADEPILIKNIEISSENPIWNNSLVLYHENRVLEIENPFENSAYSGNETHRTINITAQIDEINANEIGELLLFYADNRTIWNNTQYFSGLDSPTSIESSFTSAQTAERADVLANISLSSKEEKTLYLSYGINGGNSVYDNLLTEKNNTGITIELEENDIKQGNGPVFDQNLPSETQVVNRMVLTREGLFRIKLYTWYI